MNFKDTAAQASYRALVRAWLEEHGHEAPVLRGAGATGTFDEAAAAHRAWQRRLAEAGLAGVTWPTQYGGQGLGPIEQVIANQEIQRAGVPGIFDVVGVGMLGPTIAAHGTEEQKDRYLAPMLHADEVWCQLFSEPAAGSDLAGIQCRAVREDDGGWRLSGQKVWTTNAQLASFGLLLGRSNPDVPKHRGLTMFIVPMEGDGVTVRPLRQITGAAEFNEVFLDDVRIEPGSELGGVDGGWAVALTTLMFERLALGGGTEGQGYGARRFADAIASDPSAARDAGVRRRLGEVAADLLSLRFSAYRLLTELERGGAPGPEAALGKVTLVRAAIEGCDLVADALGPDILGDAEFAYFTSFLPGYKTAGGSEEILRNTVGERVLGLPPEPRLDKDVPFSELRALERPEHPVRVRA
jgi:alkylation response protein AidB-like acyl-CoA dehydrogenase